jgi:hypothetical protein
VQRSGYSAVSIVTKLMRMEGINWATRDSQEIFPEARIKDRRRCSLLTVGRGEQFFRSS